MTRFFLLGLLLISFISCEVSPQKIEYGSDACHYCQMTIVDQQHASQLVSTKGKAFKYDAIECMVHSLQEQMTETPMALYLVANFNEPGQLMDAEAATYLVSDQIQSPMGANLSAFPDQASAVEKQEQFTGETYSWKEIQEHLKQ